MVASYNRVLRLVLLLDKVEVVAYNVLAALVDSGKDDIHVKLSPSLLINAKRRLSKD